ncbi:MAG TPA: tetratricopeptide repeat protein [Opitutales bacterium]|nr:tetratricopeptide repeat protein [Opitutales bacterium]
MAGFRSKSFKYLAVLLFTAGSLAGQDAKPEELGDMALNEQVVELVKQNEFLRARPFLLEMKKRMEEQDNKENMEAIDFFLASSYLEEYQNSDSENKAALETAVKSFEEYVEKYPSGPRKTIALLNLGDAYSDLKQYDKAISTYTRIYNSPSTSGSVRNDIRRVISKTYLKTEKPEDGIPFYLEAYNQAILNEEAKAEAATWLLQAYLSKGDIDAILPYFNDLTGRKAALFNPKFNVTLIKAGDQLFERGNYDFAILFYAIVKKKQDIVAFYEEAVEELRLALSYKAKGSEDAISIEKRLREAEANLKAVKGIRDYDADVRWRSARVLLESQRTWEALWSFYNLMLDYPQHEQAEEFLFLAFSQARAVKDAFMVEKLAEDYLAREDYKKYRGQISLDLATYYQDQGLHEKFYELATKYLDEGAENDKVASQLANLLAIHLLERERYGELYERMQRYSNAPQEFDSLSESTLYWRSLALTIAADYDRALESFNEFIEGHGRTSMFSEDAYYRRAICVYGAQSAEAAYAEFKDFVESYPNSTRRGEAELYLGDIMREKGDMDAALGHYQKVEEFTKNQTFITKATFATSEVLEMKNKDEEAVQTLVTYIDRYGQSAELGEAYLRLGRFEERQGNIAERFRYNMLGLEATATDPNRYAADEILIGYVKDYPTYVTNYEAAIDLIEGMLDDPAYRETIMKDRAAQYKFFQSEEGMKVDPSLTQRIVRDRAFRKNLLDEPEKILGELRSDYSERLEKLRPYKPDLVFSKLLAQAGEPATVLKLRIAMGREKLSDTEVLFPFTDEQVMSASPRVMLWRAKELRPLNPAKANELLRVSLEKHPYAPNRYDTMLVMAEIAKDKALNSPSEENWQNALDQYELIIERFGMRAEDGAPFIAKGEILIELGREDEALTVLSDVLRNPEWRGEPQAKAHLFLGIAYYKMQSYAQAHGFFERLMLGFAGFRNEVALAYYWDLRTLESMNESESVNQLLTEVRGRDDLKDTKGYRLIEENYAL